MTHEDRHAVATRIADRLDDDRFIDARRRLLGVEFEEEGSMTDDSYRARELALAYSMTIDPARRLRLLGRLADLVGEDEADRLIDWAMRGAR